MLDFFTALSLIPDAIIGIGRYPKFALGSMLAIIVGFVIAGSVGQYNQNQTQLPNSAMQVLSKPEQKERRITKLAKWLWQRE